MKAYFYVTFICLFSMTLIAAEDAGKATDEAVEGSFAQATAEEVKLDDVKLPEKNSPEYWVVRSEAMGDLTPLLTKKRAEMKTKRQMLADYLLKIGKGEEMAAAEIVVPDDPALYAQALGLTEYLEQQDVTIPKKTPTWDELAEFSMRYIIHEGYVPVEFDGVEDVSGFVEVAKKKEAYAQKVRQEMRSYVKDCLKMWIYLGQIGQQAAAKEWAVQMKVDAEKGKSAEMAMIAEQRRTAALNRSESAREQEFEDAQERASFRSSRRERTYQSRDDRLQYQQTLLNERYTNYYRW